MATGNNPIRSVDGVAIPCPSAYVWKLEDLSSSGAGRTEDGMMHKQRVGQVVGIELSWANIKTPAVSQILTAFNPEYVRVTYLDAMTGTYSTDTFYVGNRSAPLYSTVNDVWSNVSFNLIRQRGN